MVTTLLAFPYFYRTTKILKNNSEHFFITNTFLESTQ
jgi:hypothetical protein